MSAVKINLPEFSLILIFENNTPTDVNKNLLNVRSINEIDIQIFDEDNNLVNFNNLDWNMTLVITTEIKLDRQEISLNSLLSKNYIDLKQPEEDLNDRLVEYANENKNVIDPLKAQQQKELDILNY